MPINKFYKPSEDVQKGHYIFFNLKYFVKMKKLVFTAIMFCAVFFFGCSNDDSNSPSFSGEWKLINVSGGLMGQNQNIPVSSIVWSINPTTQVISVVNDNNSSTYYDGLPTGIYNYQLQNDPNPSGCGTTLSIEANQDMGCILFENNHLIINSNDNDGFRMEFSQ
jgi:hypothetical protein